MKSNKWINSAKRRRVHAKFRRKLCAFLGCQVDSCYTTAELLRDARIERVKRWNDNPANQEALKRALTA